MDIAADPLVSRVLLAGAVLVAVSIGLALVERLRSGGRSALPRLDDNPAPLSTAAALAYDYARDRHLPLAAIAERKGGTRWFENSILKTVPVFATSRHSGRRTKLAAGARVCALSDGLARSENGEPDYVEPMVGAGDFRTYLRWMTSVW